MFQTTHLVNESSYLIKMINSVTTAIRNETKAQSFLLTNSNHLVRKAMAYIVYTKSSNPGNLINLMNNIQ